MKITEVENDISDHDDQISANEDDIENRCIVGEYCGEWQRATLRKLPLWEPEDRDEFEINFEWPT